MSAALLAVSCAVGVAPPSLVVPLGRNDFGDYTLVVYDDTGLVTAGRANEQPPRRGTSGVVASPERRELELAWIGGACAHRPTLRVSGTSASLQLALSNTPEPQLPFVGCPAVGLPFAVTLSLTEPVADGAAILEVTY
jgi:hypothetical protein